ncbi:CdaR family protein [Paenibacillus tengchongensis]|uniref:CdaR family protein n=1 Tax=Paenibacillus tengchongensis TaxID=2608684 RepID=UPI00124EC359|nr:CdaR family protein [Paenibacillus tengchongensis]
MDKWMKNNNFNKVLALVFAVILWTIVHVDTEPVNQTTVSTQSKFIENVKIEVINFDEEKYELTKDVDYVGMEVAGRNSDLNFKLSDDYKVMLDLEGVGPGDTTLPLHYELPNGVRLVEMDPNEVNVHIELRNTKSFPVTIVTNGEPAEGYQLGTPVITPDTAEVTMAASELEKVAKVEGTVELDGETENFTDRKLRLRAYDKDGNELKNAVISPATVSVELPISLPSKSLPLDIGFTGQLPGSLVLSRVTPEQDTVTVYGTEQALAALSTYEATIDLSAIDAPGTRQMELELQLPEGAVKIEPGTVNVSVSAAEITQKTVEDIPIRLEGVGSGLTGNIIAPAAQTMTLTVSGAPTLLDQLDKENVSIIADVGGLSAGGHQVTLQVSLPRFISLVDAAQPLTATVELHSPVSTPESTEASQGGVQSTPEPSAEPVIGEEPVPEPSPSEEATSPASPTPSESPAESGNSSTGGNDTNAGAGGGT